MFMNGCVNVWIGKGPVRFSLGVCVWGGVRERNVQLCACMRVDACACAYEWGYACGGTRVRACVRVCALCCFLLNTYNTLSDKNTYLNNLNWAMHLPNGPMLVWYFANWIQYLCRKNSKGRDWKLHCKMFAMNSETARDSASGMIL